MWLWRKHLLWAQIMTNDPTRQLRVIAVLVVTLAGVFITRLFFLQVLSGEAYASEANRQYRTPGESGFNRGTIYFTEKSGQLVSAATLEPSFFITINPSAVLDGAALWEKVKSFGIVTEEDFLAKISKKDDPYEVIAKKVNAKIAAQVTEADLSTVSVHQDKVRFYPADTRAAHVLGFVARTAETGDALIGRYGIEHQYEDVLARGEKRLYVNFFAELFGDISEAIFDRDERSEGDVALTIEPTVQGELEKRIAEIMNKFSALEAGGIVMDPKTGRILAMAALPNFSPGKYGEVEDAATYSNPLVESVYEMGSIVKPLTMASGLDAGAVTTETTYDDWGKLDIKSYTIRNYDGRGRGKDVPMQEVLNQSLNTGAVFVMQELGVTRFQRYMKGFGFGELTGVDLPNEGVGLTANIDSGRPVELATASFGQGFAVSPLSMTRALASLANGGLIVRPHLVESIIYPLSKDDIETKIERRVLDERTSELITRMLVEVVDKALLGGTVKLDRYTVAAKTGTAQLASPNGGYYEDRYLHSFFGYAPAFDARFLTFLYLREPQGVKYASETLTKPFMDMTKFLLHYYDVPPDR